MNGQTIAEVPLHRMQWGDPWHNAGAIPLDDAFVTWATVRAYDACAYGVLRHLAGLLAGGYGDTPEEIVGWFRDLDALEWIVDGARYRIDRDVAPLEGLVGSAGAISFDEYPMGYFPALNLTVGERTYPIILCDADWRRAFLCATVVDVAS